MHIPNLSDASIDAVLRDGLRNLSSSAYGGSSTRRPLHEKFFISRDAVVEDDSISGTLREKTPASRALFTDPISALDDDEFLYGHRMSGGSTTTARPPLTAATTVRSNSTSRSPPNDCCLFPPESPHVEQGSPPPSYPSATRPRRGDALGGGTPRERRAAAQPFTPTPRRAGDGVEEIDTNADDAGTTPSRYRSAARPRCTTPRPTSAGAGVTPRAENRPFPHVLTPEVRRFVSAMRSAVEPDSPPPPPAHGTADNAATTHPHIMRRMFRIAADATVLALPTAHTVTAQSVPPVMCDIERVFSSASTEAVLNDDDEDSPDARLSAATETLPQFSHASEVSTLVNVGDVAHCRVIELRAAFSSEREAQVAMLEATRALVKQIDVSLSVSIPSPYAEEPTAAGIRCAAKRDDEDDEAAAGNRTPVEQTVLRDTDSVRRLREQLADFANATETSGHATTKRTSLESSDDDDVNEEKKVATAVESTPLEDGCSGTEGDVFEAGKRLMPFCNDTLRQDINDVLARCGSLTASGAHYVAELLKLLRLESTAVTAAASASAVNNQLDPDVHWQVVEALRLREGEAKAAGNLSLCARIRKDIIEALATALDRTADVVEHASTPFSASTPARALTERVLAQAKNASVSHAEALHHTVSLLRKDVENDECNLAAMTDRVERQAHETYLFLNENDRVITDIMSQIDDLYGKLDAAVHSRNNHLKHFVRQHASSVYSVALEESLVEARRRRLSSLSDRLISARGTAEVISDFDRLVSATRSHVEQRHADAARQSALLRDSAASACRRFFDELRHTVDAWIDVLVNNAARESEREASIRAAIADAVERYHQADHDMYQQQLTESAARRKASQAEASACEQLLARCANRMESILGGGEGQRPPTLAVPGTPQRDVREGTTSAATLFTSTVESPVPQRSMTSTALVSWGASHRQVPLSPAPSQHCAAVAAAVDDTPIEQLVELFPKADATRVKWLLALREIDIETGKDLRCLRAAGGVWATVLHGHPLLKSMLEQLLDDPEKYMEFDHTASPTHPE